MTTTAVTATARRASAPSGPTAAALFSRGAVEGSLGNWQKARRFFEAAAEARPGFAMARSSAAVAALLDHRGARDEAGGYWSTAIRLDPRYLQPDWLLQSRRWPPLPLRALQSLLCLVCRPSHHTPRATAEAAPSSVGT